MCSFHALPCPPFVDPNAPRLSVQELRELETIAADPARLAALPPQEQQEHDTTIQNTGDQLRNLLYFASGTIRLLATSTQQITAPFLLPEMVERLAAMLNYFLLYLTGPERKSLKVGESISLQYGSPCMTTSLVPNTCHIGVFRHAWDSMYVNRVAVVIPGCMTVLTVHTDMACART